METTRNASNISISTTSEERKEKQKAFGFPNENEFKWLVFLSLFDVFQMAHMINYSLQVNGFIGVVILFLIYVVVGVPLLLSQLLLGYFSQMSYLTVWKICPILQGLGITMTIINWNRTTLALEYTFQFFKYLLLGLQGSPPYSMCKTEEKECVSLHSNKSRRTKCCREIKRTLGQCEERENNELLYPALHFYQYKIASRPDFQHWRGFFRDMGWDTIVLLPLLMLLIFYITAKGLFLFNKSKIKKLIIFFIVMIASFGIELMFGPGWKVFNSEFLFFYLSTLETIVMEIKIAIIVVIKNINFSSGMMITLGSYMHTKCNIQRHAITTLMSKFFLSLLFSYLIMMAASTVSAFHGVDFHCITLSNGWLALYVIPTEFLNTTSAVTIILSFLYFSTLMTLMLVYLAIVTNIMIDGIMDFFPKMNISRSYILVGVLLSITMYSFVLTGPSFNFLAYIITEVVHPMLSLGMCVLYTFFVFWVYGVNRLYDDLYFITGSKPSKFWKIAWHADVIIFLIMTPICIYIRINHSDLTYDQQKASIAMTIIFAAPALLGAFFQYTKALKANNCMLLIKADLTWGPPSENLRFERKNFNPSGFIRHKERHLKCYHNCLLGNQELRAFIKRIEAKRHAYYTYLGRTTTREQAWRLD